MQIIKWANGKGQKLILSEKELAELKKALHLAEVSLGSKGECGSFEVEIEE